MSAKRVAVVVCLATIMVGCSGADDGDTSGLPRFSPPPSAAPSTQAPASAPSDAEQIVEGYRDYTAAMSRALAEGDADLPALRASATGQAFNDARARVRANRQNGVVTTGALEPSATTAGVEWPGGGQATIVDCLLNGLGHVEADHPDVVVAQANGTRRPVEAVLSRTSNGWAVTRVEMPQDEDTANRQKGPSFLRGPMPDGPPSCAPPELEQELLARYQAFWDAFDRAFGFGRDGPANPDDPALAETQVNPQLSDTRSAFRELNEKNQTSEGQPDSHRPWVLASTDFDRVAIVADCVSLGESSTLDLDTGEVVSTNSVGQVNYYETQLTMAKGAWKVRNWEVIAEGIDVCEPPR
jgi:hypothetical protein